MNLGDGYLGVTLDWKFGVPHISSKIHPSSDWIKQQAMDKPFFRSL
jgi:hypothetical protein